MRALTNGKPGASDAGLRNDLLGWPIGSEHSEARRDRQARRIAFRFRRPKATARALAELAFAPSALVNTTRGERWKAAHAAWLEMRWLSKCAERAERKRAHREAWDSQIDAIIEQRRASQAE